jgi:hypothetical protein
VPAKRFACPCCGQLTLSERDQYDICGVCGWEDEPFAEDYPWSSGGPNGPESLWEAQVRVGRITRGEYEELRAAEVDRRSREHLAALGRALGQGVGAGSMVSSEEADRLSLAVWNGPLPSEPHRRWLDDATAVDALLARLARRVPRDLDVIVLTVTLDDLSRATSRRARGRCGPGWW